MSNLNKYKICIIAGDGIGKEIMSAAIKILDKLSTKFEFTKAEAGYAAYKKYKTPLPLETIKKCKKSDTILFGAVTTPPNIKNYFSPIVKLRKELNLFANIRPCFSLPLKNIQKNIDILIVRENTEGLYSGLERERGNRIVSERVITKQASENIINHAFEIAKKQNRKKVTLVHKANVIRKADGLFLTIGQNLSKKYPNIIFEDRLVDSCAYQIVRNPTQFDIIVTTNMFGDILSDLTSALTGGLGVAASASIGSKLALFEPVHGSAPDIAGQNKANPIAMFFSVVMMLDYLKELSASRKLKQAIFKTLKQGCFSYDLGGHKTTQQITRQVIKNLKK